jgi:hypothetical protein
MQLSDINENSFLRFHDNTFSVVQRQRHVVYLNEHKRTQCRAKQREDKKVPQYYTIRGFPVLLTLVLLSQYVNK